MLLGGASGLRHHHEGALPQLFGRLAQLGEPQIYILLVTGSSPVSPTIQHFFIQHL